jgi:hypothetical protein
VLGILLAVALPAYQKYQERVRKAESAAASQIPASQAKPAPTKVKMQEAAVAPAIPVAAPPVAAETTKPAIDAVKAPAAPPPVVNSPPPAKPSAPVAAAKKKAREEQAPIRVASESPEMAKPKPKAKVSECVYKPVMSDEDIAKCR